MEKEISLVDEILQKAVSAGLYQGTQHVYMVHHAWEVIKAKVKDEPTGKPKPPLTKS